MTTPIGHPAHTAATTPSTGTPSTSTAGKDLNGTDFLTLLVAQMKYQNPNSPQDGQAYMQEMAQFTMVQKLTDVATAQTSALAWQKTLAAEGMLGRTVSGTTDGGSKATGTVTGVTTGSAGATLQLASGATMAVEQVTSVTATATGDSRPGSAGR